MLEYYDRKGKQITEQEWRKLTLKSGYQIVKNESGKQEGVKVKTGWCGVRLTTYEEKPLLFLTEVFLNDKELENKRKWSSTEETAMKEHNLACEVADYSLPATEEKSKRQKK